MQSDGFFSVNFGWCNSLWCEALIAETVVWPNFFLMNVFFAFKGSKLFIIICAVTLYTRLRYMQFLLPMQNAGVHFV